MRLLGDGKLTAGEDDCPSMRALLDRIGDKWSVRVVVLLDRGTLRFNALRRSMRGVSQRVLTSTLRSLERDGLVARTVRPTRPPQVDYALTDVGRSLLGPIEVLAAWAERHRARTPIDREP